MRRIDLIVHGATGRMGQRIIDLARASAQWRIVATVSRDGVSTVLEGESASRPGATASAENPDAMGNMPLRADIIIDFSGDAGARSAAALAQQISCALLTGSTGLSQPTIDALEQLARRAPVLAAPNTSRGVAVVARLAAQAAALGEDFDPVIIETHHTTKFDAPSGTALRLAGALRAAGVQIGDDQVISVRAGHVIGEHIIRFEGPHESIEIIHRAHSRDLFAAGALAAGAWLVTQAPRLYTMEDVLGFARDGSEIAASSRK